MHLHLIKKKKQIPQTFLFQGFHQIVQQVVSEASNSIWDVQVVSQLADYHSWYQPTLALKDFHFHTIHGQFQSSQILQVAGTPILTNKKNRETIIINKQST